MALEQQQRRPNKRPTSVLLVVGAAVIAVATAPLTSASSETPCFTCAGEAVSDRQQAAQLKVAAIKHQILSKLHLRGRPNITTPLPRELALEALRRTQGNLPSENEIEEDEMDNESRGVVGDDYYARTSEIIAFAEPGVSVNGHVLLDFFPLKEHSQRNLKVTAATLWIQLRYSPSLPKRLRHLLRDHQLTLYVFRVNNDTSEALPMELLTSYKLGTATAGWRRLDIDAAVQQWLAGGSLRQNKLTLLVDCVGCDSLLEMVLFHDTGQQHANSSNSTTAARLVRHGGASHHEQLVSLRPFLAIATESAEEQQNRPRRHSKVCHGRVTHCCRQNLYVSFKELGWDDWIIAPKGYYANFCMGDCVGRRTPDTYATFHTHVIEEYRNRNPYASIHPCCAPTRLSPMSLIYFDPDLNIIKTDLPKMIVDECGCT